MEREVYPLAGPTAGGKTAAAAILARRMGAAVLSADSMLVYRGMDLGTAKPTAEEREGYPLGGIDLVDPSEDFSAGAWLRAAALFVSGLPEGMPIIVAGGTGLYFSALLRGLDREWTDPPPEYPVIDVPRDVLRVRAAARIEGMFASGWVDEVRSLLVRFPEWSRTARYAIGYAEIRERILSDGAPAPHGSAEWDAVKAKILVRTMRLVKHQATWFRHQSRAIAVEGGPAEAVADRVESAWRAHGPWLATFPPADGAPGGTQARETRAVAGCGIGVV